MSSRNAEWKECMADLKVTNQIPTDKIFFSREQYEYLNKIFPEVLPTAEANTNKLFIASGNRQVVFFVRDRVRG